MRNKIYVFLLAAGMLAALASLAPLSRKVHAQSYWNRLQGSWAFQFTGDVFIQVPGSCSPGPLCPSPYDGPFFRNGLAVFDGLGNVNVKGVAANYNGFVEHDTYSGTYVLNPDGTFTITIPNLSVPFLPPNTPNTFTFEGVLGNNGLIAKVALTGISVPALGGAQANIGSVITGEFVRQSE